MDAEEAIKKSKCGRKMIHLKIGKKNNLESIKKRLSGWQLESFNESYEYKINNGMSLFKKNQIKE